MSPLQRYEEGVLGTNEYPGRGLPSRFLGEDVSQFRLNLMPFEEHEVHQCGIVFDDIYYYHDVLHPWINAADPCDKSGRRKRKFTIRRDPHDISVVYFYDSEAGLYREIPYRNSSHPAISLWELHTIRQLLAKNGCNPIDEASIFEAYTRLSAIHISARQTCSDISTLGRPTASIFKNIKAFDDIDSLEE